MADVSLEVTQGTGVDTVARAGESCRLARGLDQSGEIDPKIAERAAAVVAEFAGRARSLGSRNIVLAATAALRSARNGDQVAALIGDRSGLRVRVLAGEDEARMVYRAVIGGLGPMASRSACVVFDVGGGSTEVVSGFGLEPGRWVSLPFGAVSLTERLLRTDPPAPAEIAELRSHVSQQLMHECAYLPDRAPLLAGVGGTITLLACLDRGLTAYEPGMVEGHAIPVDRLRERIASLCAMSQARRRELPVMGEGRADIVVAGALIVDEVVRRFPTGSLVCSTRGLRYALARLAAEEAASGGNDGATPPAGEPRS